MSNSDVASATVSGNLSDETLNRYLSRKFALALLVVLSATMLVCFKHISDGVYSAVVIAVVGAYFAANVYQTSTSTKPTSGGVL